jgi:hypothetical protein
MEALIKKVPISQVIEGRNVHEIMNTKEIAELLNISTKKAYLIMIEMEANGNACKYGYKTKEGFEDPSFSTLKTNSLYWQIYS